MGTLSPEGEQRLLGVRLRGRPAGGTARDGTGHLPGQQPWGARLCGRAAAARVRAGAKRCPAAPGRARTDGGRGAAGGASPSGRGRWARGFAGRGGKAAGRGGDLWAFQASRCLLRPPIVPPGSQWGRRSRSAGPRGGRSPARARWYPAARARGVCAVGASVRAASVRPALGAGPVRLASVPAHIPPARPAGTPRADGAPLAVAPAPPAPSGTRLASLARPAPLRPRRTHRGPFFPASCNHMANPRRHSSPRSFRRRMSRNREQSQLCSPRLWMRKGEKKNHLTPRDSQLITHHM